MSEFPGLSNQFLIAMPALGDPNFHHTVMLICEHNEDGALGIVINRPLGVQLGEIFVQLDLDEPDPSISQRKVLSGGPIQQERGFVLHRPSGPWESTIQVSDELGVTSSRDVLTAIAKGTGPADAIVALGYAGWMPGQLEDEMQANAWLSVPASSEIIFKTPYAQRWQGAARLVGVDIETLGIEAGHA